MNAIQVNTLPSPTYRFLRVNDSILEVPSGIAPADDSAWKGLLPAGGLSIREIREAETDGFVKIAGGMGDAADRLFQEAGVRPWVLDVPAGSSGETVYLPVKAAGGRAQLHALCVEAGEGSDVSVILDISGEEAGCAAAKGLTGISVRIRAAQDAKVHLIPVQRLGSTIRHFEDIGAVCAERACVRLTTLCLGGSGGHLGAKCALAGDASSFDSETGYYVRGDAELDINAVATHQGKQTDSRMIFRGVLADRAKKTLRGTIDFLTGSSDSVGDEQEDTLLLSPDVENRSVPVILCAEESVDGRHGATVGQLSEDMVFYMCSRGYSKEQARRLIVQARLKSVASRIPEGKLRWEVEQWIEREIG